PFRIELAGNVVEKEQRSTSLRRPQALDFGDLEGEDRRARLTLAREATSGLVAERDGEVVCVRTDAGVSALAIARKTAGEGAGQAHFELAFSAERCLGAEPVRVAARRLVDERQGCILARDLGESAGRRAS